MGMRSLAERKAYKTDIPEGTHLAICVGLFDIGTVFNKTHNKHQRKMVLVFELCEERDAEGFPKLLDQAYTQTLAPNGNLLPHVNSWRGIPLKKDELKNFDIIKFGLGRPANLLVGHSDDLDDPSASVYANIIGIQALPKGYPAPTPMHPLLSFDFDVDTEIPEGTPERIAGKISESPEWKQLQAGKRPGGGTANGKANGKAAEGRSRSDAGQQAPAEIVEILNECGIGYPYSQEELDARFPPDMSQDVYAILSKHAIPF